MTPFLNRVLTVLIAVDAAFPQGSFDWSADWRSPVALGGRLLALVVGAIVLRGGLSGVSRLALTMIGIEVGSWVESLLKVRHKHHEGISQWTLLKEALANNNLPAYYAYKDVKADEERTEVSLATNHDLILCVLLNLFVSTHHGWTLCCRAVSGAFGQAVALVWGCFLLVQFVRWLVGLTGSFSDSDGALFALRDDRSIESFYRGPQGTARRHWTSSSTTATEAMKRWQEARAQRPAS